MLWPRSIGSVMFRSLSVLKIFLHSQTSGSRWKRVISNRISLFLQLLDRPKVDEKGERVDKNT
jgi:hypothetical protein